MSLVFVLIAFLMSTDGSIVVRKCCNMSSRFTNSNCVEHSSITSKFFEILKSDGNNLMVTYGVPNCTNRTLAGEIIELNRTLLKILSTGEDTCLDVVDEELTQFTCAQTSHEGSVHHGSPKRTHTYVYFRLMLMVSSALLLLQLALKYMKMPPTIHNRGVLSSSSTLAGSYFVLVLVTLMRHHNTKLPLLCIITGILLHFLLLTHFFWLNVISYDLWKTFGKESLVENSKTSNFGIYSQYAWGCPISIVVVTALAEFLPYVPHRLKPMFGGIVCFFGSPASAFLYLHSFLLLIVVSNFMMFILITRNLRRHARTSERLSRDKIRFTLYIRLSLFMGLSWIINLAQFIIPNEQDWPWIIHFSNDLQGVIIFCTFRWSSSKILSCLLQPTLNTDDEDCASIDLKKTTSKTGNLEADTDTLSDARGDDGSSFSDSIRLSLSNDVQSSLTDDEESSIHGERVVLHSPSSTFIGRILSWSK